MSNYDLTDTELLNQVESLISKYHLSLDKRDHVDIAQDKLVKSLEELLEVPWIQGAELQKEQENLLEHNDVSL